MTTTGRVKALVLSAVFGVALWLLPSVVRADMTWTSSTTTGFGDANNSRVYTLAEYSGKLYAGTLNTVTGGEVWQYNGSAWTQVNTNGFGDANNGIISGLAVYGNYLYAATLNSTTGTEIWKYDGTTWTQANTDGFGDVNNNTAYALAVFRSKLFVGTYNAITGSEIWSYNGTTWTQENTDGFGSNLNWYVDSFAQYKGKLVVGVGNTTTGGQVWRYDGSTWESLNATGFGSVNNTEPYSLYTDGDTLYLGTWNDVAGAEVWTYDGTSFTRIASAGFDDTQNGVVLSIIKYNGTLTFGTRNTTNGGQVWQYNGSTWSQANTDGFGSSANTRAYNLTEFNHQLYTGTANDTTGGQVWLASVADTTGPTFSSLSPANNATGVAPTANLTFFVDDTTWEVDTDSLDVTISGTAAIVDGVFQSGYSGTLVSDGHKGYTVTVNPAADWYYRQTLSVSANASDALANASSTTWSFQTIETIPSLGIVITPASKGGPNVRVVNELGTQLSSFFAYDSSSRIGMQVAQADIDGDNVNEIVVAPGAGATSQIKAFELNGTLIASVTAFNAGFKGGVNLATGDFNGDHREDIVVAPISAGGPNVRIYTLNSAGTGFTLMDSFFAFHPDFRGGVNLAAGDINGDNIDEIVLAPRGQAGPEVRLYHYNAPTGHFTLTTSVMAYQTTFRGGVQLATGDLDANGSDDIITSPYLNGGPNVRAYILTSANKLQLLAGTMAYPTTYRGTLSMSVGDLDKDGFGEIVLAPKTLGDSLVKVFRYGSSKLNLVDSFMAYDTNFRGGVNIFVNDVENDGFAEVMTSPASKGGPNVRVYDYDTGAEILKKWFWVFPVGFRGGVNFGK